MPPKKGAQPAKAAKSAKVVKVAKSTAPDDLVRAAAGSYRSADGRFEVQKSGPSWFLIDGQQTDELGQPRLHGPFATLSDVTTALPGARALKLLRRPPKRRSN